MNWLIIQEGNIRIAINFSSIIRIEVRTDGIILGSSCGCQYSFGTGDWCRYQISQSKLTTAKSWLNSNISGLTINV